MAHIAIFVLVACAAEYAVLNCMMVSSYFLSAAAFLVLFMPYQMTASCYFMFAMAVSKIYVHQFEGGLWSYSFEQKVIYAFLMVGFPFVMHTISRYYLLRKARGMKFVQKKGNRFKA